MFFLFTVFFVGISIAGVKYVAVVETDVDASSGASDELKSAEVREITAELRRQATENLPRDKYSVMTSETVQSMGGAVLEECAEENCIITLGSRIGADYIVRGTVSKFQTMFTLGIELYETENGTLVVSSEAVRSENLVELLKMAATASGNMFRKFAGAKGSAQKKSNAGTEKSESVTDKKRKTDLFISPKYQLPVGMPVSWGGVNVETGWVWKNGVFVGFDASFGINNVYDSIAINGIMGMGINFGGVYNLVEQLQIVYGGSAGIWIVADGHIFEYKGYKDAHYASINYLAPFVKLRWNFIELSYRGLLGHQDLIYNRRWDNGMNDYDNDAVNITDFGWNSHQLMLGLYFVIPKRTR